MLRLPPRIAFLEFGSNSIENNVYFVLHFLIFSSFGKDHDIIKLSILTE